MQRGAEMAMKRIEVAHEMFRDGDFEGALEEYTDALSMAKSPQQKIALHSNRAACFLKLQRFNQAAEECTAVLQLDQQHAGALMLRAQTLVTLKEYHSALFDVSRLVELNPSSDSYRNLESRLRTQLVSFSCLPFGFLSFEETVFFLFRFMNCCVLFQGKSLAPIPESESELEVEDEDDDQEAEATVAEEQPVYGEAENLNPTTPSEESVVVEEPITVKQLGVVLKTEPRKSIAAEVIAQAKRKVPLRSKEDDAGAEAEAGATPKEQNSKQPFQSHSKGWQTIPKPKGHSALDYARWDRVDDDSCSDSDNETDDDDDDSSPQYRFRVKPAGATSVP